MLPREQGTELVGDDVIDRVEDWRLAFDQVDSRLDAERLTRGLTQQQRRIVALTYAGYTAAEIGAWLRYSRSTVTRELAKTRARLRAARLKS